MKPHFLLPTLILASQIISCLSQHQFTGYFQSWTEKWASVGSDLTLANFPPYVNTIIIAFFQPDTAYVSGSISLSGTGLDFSADGSVVKEAIRIAKSKGAKVLIAIGGSSYQNWGSLNTDGIAAFVKDFEVDGVDISYQPAAPNCISTDGTITCDSDQEFQDIINKIRTALPPPTLISLAGWSIGAYGEGDFANAQPQGANTGVCISLLKSDAGKKLDQVNILSYGAGDVYDPTQAFQAYRSLFDGLIMLGVSVPPEDGGHAVSLDEVDKLCEFVKDNGNKGDGMMLWTLNKVLEGTPSATNPDATIISQEVCNNFDLGGCEQGLDSSIVATEEAVLLNEEADINIEDLKTNNKDTKRQFVGYFQTWTEKWAGKGSDLSFANYPAYITTIIFSFFQPDNAYVAGSSSMTGTGLDFSSEGSVIQDGINIAKSKGAKVLIAVGGATFQNWAQLNTEGIAAFVQDFGLDGVDIDYQPAEANCKADSDGKVTCATDKELEDVVTQIRGALPSPLLVSVAGSSVGAYGVGDFKDATPKSTNTGGFVNLLNSDAGKSIDQINILSFGAGDTYDPTQAFNAYRSLFKGMITLGVTVPPDNNGKSLTIGSLAVLGDFISKNGQEGDGMMLWSLNRAIEGDASAKNPDATMISQEVCQKLGLADCKSSLNAPASPDVVIPDPTPSEPGVESPPFDSPLSREFTVYFQSWSERLGTDGSELSLAHLPTYITTFIVSFFQPDNSYNAGSLNLFDTGLGFGASGAVVRDAIRIARSKGTKVLLGIGGTSYQNWKDLNTDGIAAFVKDFELDGIDIDYEFVTGDCTPEGQGVKCGTDEVYYNAVSKLRKALPANTYLSVALKNLGAFGIGDFVNSKPQGLTTSTAVNLLDKLGDSIDQVNILAFDAGPIYDPKEAFKAYRALFDGKIALGVEVPPEAWGGHVLSISELVGIADFVNKNGEEGDGMMLWTLNKRAQGEVTSTNPDSRMIAEKICERLQLGDCNTKLDLPGIMESRAGIGDLRGSRIYLGIQVYILMNSLLLWFC